MTLVTSVSSVRTALSGEDLWVKERSVPSTLVAWLTRSVNLRTQQSH